LVPDQKRLENNRIGLHYQAHLRWRFRVFWICTKNVCVLLLFCTIRNKVQYENKTYREILPLYIIFSVIIDMITHCFDTAFTTSITYYLQALLYTAFDLQRLKIVWSCCTQNWHQIKMIIFNITAILQIIHTIDSGVNFTTRDLQPAKKN